MPELPEVESVRKLIIKYCVGKRVKSIEAPPDNSMSGYMTVKGVLTQRYIRLKIEDMEVWPPRFMKYIITFDDGTELGYGDARRFGRVKMLEDVENNPPISKLGFDPLTCMIDLESFKTLLQKRSLPIKALLLDQAFAAGVGNYYADEILYQARVYPDVQANQLDDTQIESIHKWIYKVAEIACECNDKLEEYPQEWLFHYRWAKNKVAHDYYGNKISFDDVGGRTTAYVTALQKKSGNIIKNETQKQDKKQSQKALKSRQNDSDEEDQKVQTKEKGTQKKEKTKKQGLQINSNGDITSVNTDQENVIEQNNGSRKVRRREEKLVSTVSPKKKSKKSELKDAISDKKINLQTQKLDNFEYEQQEQAQQNDLQSNNNKFFQGKVSQRGRKAKPERKPQSKNTLQGTDNNENINTVNILRPKQEVQKQNPEQLQRRSRTQKSIQPPKDSPSTIISKTQKNQPAKKNVKVSNTEKVIRSDTNENGNALDKLKATKRNQNKPQNVKLSPQKVQKTRGRAKK